MRPPTAKTPGALNAMPAFGLVVVDGDPLVVGELWFGPVLEGVPVDFVAELAVTPGKRSPRQSSGIFETNTLWSAVGHALMHVTKGEALPPSHVVQVHRSRAAPVSPPSQCELMASRLVQSLMRSGVGVLGEHAGCCEYSEDKGGGQHGQSLIARCGVCQGCVEQRFK